MTKIFYDGMSEVTKTEKEINDEFLGYIRQHQESVYGFESYGDGSEFFDEDGCVLFTIREIDKENIAFKFSNAEDFDFVLRTREADQYTKGIYKEPLYV